MPARIGFTTLSDPAHPVTGEGVFADWSTVQGIRFARRWTVFRRGVRGADANDAAVTVNAGLRPEDRSKPPADFKPVFPSR